MTYTDSTGEDPAAPDITTLVVSNNDAGVIQFRVNVPNRPAFGQDMLVLLFVDSDSNAATGDPDSLGADYAIQLIGGEAALFRWDGTDFTRAPGNPPATSLLFSYQGGATITISAAELGNTRRLGFATIVVSGVVINNETGDLDFTNAVSDAAPAAGAGLYQYQVIIATSPPPGLGPTPRPERSYTDVSRLPSRIKYTGRSIKHVRLGEKMYRTMKRLGVPRVVAIACWSREDWPSVYRSAGGTGSPNRVSGFWLPRQARWVHVAPKQCQDVQLLLNSRALNGQRSYALTTILHERVHAQGVRQEAQTECYAVQLVYEFARELNFVHRLALRLEQLAVRKSRALAPRGYWDTRRCRDGGLWDLYPDFRNLTY